MANFTKEHKITDITLPLGFTFSFPCSQEGLTKASLVTWTKGFKCSGVEGEDVVKLLREAIARRGVSQKITQHKAPMAETWYPLGILKNRSLRLQRDLNFLSCGHKDGWFSL